MKINMNNLIKKNDTFKALPSGEYKGTVIGATISQTNRPRLIIEFQLIGDKSLNGAMLNNRKEKWSILLDTEYTANILDGLFKGLQYEPALDDEGSVDIIEIIQNSELIGKLSTIVLEETTYTNQDGEVKPINRVKRIKKLEFEELTGKTDVNKIFDEIVQSGI